jgi:hypothetical protein
MNETLKKELEELVEEYSQILQKINVFIEANKLNYDEVWYKVNQLDENVDLGNKYEKLYEVVYESKPKRTFEL